MSDDDLSSARHREQVRRDIAQFEIVVERSNARARQVGSVVMLVDGQPIAGIDPAFYFGAAAEATAGLVMAHEFKIREAPMADVPGGVSRTWWHCSCGKFGRYWTSCVDDAQRGGEAHVRIAATRAAG